MKLQRLIVFFVLSGVMLLGASLGIVAQESAGEFSPVLFVSGLEGGSGSTIGPDGALYVAENAVGKISRVDPESGEVTTFASGLPARVIHTGGVMDIAFIDETAYALVTLIGEAVGGTADGISGIYRIDDEESFTLIADLSEFSIDNPPATDFFVPDGLQYAMEVFGEGFLVTDGHHNRVLQVTLDGDITEFMTFENVAPTGLEVSASSNIIYMAEAGPVPHLPENGKLTMFEPGSSTAIEVASGARLPVDVEYGCCGILYLLAQGEQEEGSPDGAPALPNTGSLVMVNSDGTFTELVAGLNLPTSFEFIGNTAYIVTLDGEIWTIEGLSL
jgi:sugar lactone lactonase YvrE